MVICMMWIRAGICYGVDNKKPREALVPREVIGYYMLCLWVLYVVVVDTICCAKYRLYKAGINVGKFREYLNRYSGIQQSGS